MVVGLDIKNGDLSLWATVTALVQQHPQLQFWSTGPLPSDFLLPQAAHQTAVDVWLYSRMPDKRPRQPYVIWLTGNEDFFWRQAPVGLRHFWEQRRLQRWLKKAAAIAVPAKEHQHLLNNKFKIPVQRLHLLQPLLPPLSEHIDATKEKWGGAEAFAATGTDVMTALKAFSIFKKRQQSTWKLIWLGDVAEAQNVLAGYKYKNDVVALPLAHSFTIVPAVYALFCIAPALWWHPVFVAAGQAGVPIVAQEDAVVTKIAGAAVQIVAAATPESFAEALMQLYKDESLHNRLSQAAVAANVAAPAVTTVTGLQALLAAAAPTFVPAKS